MKTKPIFGKKHAKTKEVGNKMVGVLLPPNSALYITMFVMANNTTKTAVLADVITKWITDTEVKNPMEQLVLKLKNNLETEWEDAKKGKIRLHDFKARAETELLKKGLPKEFIKAILSKIY